MGSAPSRVYSFAHALRAVGALGASGLSYCYRPVPLLLLIFAATVSFPATTSVSARSAEKTELSTPTNSRIPRKVPYQAMANADGVRIMYKFAACLVGANRTDVVSLLATAMDSPEQAAIVKRMFGNGSACLRDASRMGMSSVLFRGGLAEVIYRQAMPPRPTASGVSDSDPTGDFVWSSGTPNDKGALIMLTRCFVVAHPDMVHDLLQTAPASREELAALSSLSLTFGSCLPVGAKMTINPLMLRTALAEAQYGRLVAAAGR